MLSHNPEGFSWNYSLPSGVQALIVVQLTNSAALGSVKCHKMRDKYANLLGKLLAYFSSSSCANIAVFAEQFDAGAPLWSIHPEIRVFGFAQIAIIIATVIVTVFIPRWSS